MSNTILLHKKDKGKIVQVPCKIDYLTSKDESETCSFYEAVASLVGNPEIFAPDNTLSSDLGGGGIVLGVRAENRLVCVRILTFNHDTISEYEEVLGGKFASLPSCSDGCVVDSRYRGNNLQLLTWFQIESLLHDKSDCVVATVSPKNLVSLKNLFACGFMIVKRANMYGGHERLILKKELTDVQSVKTAGHMEINVHDRVKMTDMFSRGYVGYKMRHRSAGVNILFGQEIR